MKAGGMLVVASTAAFFPGPGAVVTLVAGTAGGWLLFTGGGWFFRSLLCFPALMLVLFPVAIYETATVPPKTAVSPPVARTSNAVKQPPPADSPVKPPPASATGDAAGAAHAAPPAQTEPVTPPAKPAQDPAHAASVRAFMRTLVANEFVKRMDVEAGRFYVDGQLWETFELDNKEQIVKATSQYRDVENGLPQVTLYESRSGNELASYGVFSGVTIR
jgi:hypothetical protein